MTLRTSCGILVLAREGALLLCHATGTPWWDIPKGGREQGETEEACALRETAEETGLRFVPSALSELGRFDYRPGKNLHLFATVVALADVDPSTLVCTTHFRDRQGRLLPEMDRYAWTAFADVPRRCAGRMAQLLDVRIGLAGLLDRLAA